MSFLTGVEGITTISDSFNFYGNFQICGSQGLFPALEPKICAINCEDRFSSARSTCFLNDLPAPDLLTQMKKVPLISLYGGGS